MHTPPHFGSAPRRVPRSLQVVNLFNGFSQVGWLVFGFGMIFFWAFTSNADLSFLTFRGSHETVEGRVTEVKETGASENRVQVRANHYEYSVAGKFLTGTSYSTGPNVATGEMVTVEYDQDDPARSRIEGMRRAMFGPGVLFVALFPLIGLVLLIPAVITGLKRNRVLRDGLVANGKLISKHATNVRINRMPLYELRFEFTSRDGRRCEAKARTTDTSRLEDEAQEPLLYDPADPTRAYLLDDAPARPQFEPNGDLRGNPARAIRMMILPAIVIGAHGWILWMKVM
jgi:Protein of unknown function (DUF3592)